jgi:hypothetical protein
MKEYILKPIMTPTTVNRSATADKPAVARTRPPRQPLPAAVLEPGKPRLALGLDVHLEFIMAVAQKDHAPLQSPRKFTREQLVAFVRQSVAAAGQRLDKLKPGGMMFQRVVQQLIGRRRGHVVTTLADLIAAASFSGLFDPIKSRFPLVHCKRTP